MHHEKTSSESRPVPRHEVPAAFKLFRTAPVETQTDTPPAVAVTLVGQEVPGRPV
jgi:hypothetical protein